MLFQKHALLQLDPQANREGALQDHPLIILYVAIYYMHHRNYCQELNLLAYMNGMSYCLGVLVSENLRPICFGQVLSLLYLFQTVNIYFGQAVTFSCVYNTFI
jgi:hypothetical protein